MKVTVRNAAFQQWEALLTNRNKRQRTGKFIIQGVRPISLAVANSWPLHELLYPSDRRLSDWARQMIRDSGAATVEVDPGLLAELGERSSGEPELIAVAGVRPDDMDRWSAGPRFLGVVFDRPTSPGNVGTLIRSADAFGAAGVVVAGHAADVYDPKTVRASTGSLFTLPVIRVPSADDVVRWVLRQRQAGVAIRVVGTDEHGARDIGECDLTGPTVVVVGNETSGMSTKWRNSCDEIARVPIGGGASSLNAAVAGTIVLYEAARQRGFAHAQGR